MAAVASAGTITPSTTCRAPPWSPPRLLRPVPPGAPGPRSRPADRLRSGRGGRNRPPLQIDIELKRDGHVQQGAETGKGKLVEQLTLTAVLHSDGTPMTNNPLDPEDGKRQLERAQRSQQKVQAAQAKHGSNAGGARRDVAAMQARAQQMMAKCGQDRECLMREASAMSAAQVAGGDKATQAKLQAYGQAASLCERQSARRRKPARPTPGARPAAARTSPTRSSRRPT
jgi:hypothetical protein